MLDYLAGRDLDNIYGELLIIFIRDYCDICAVFGVLFAFYEVNAYSVCKRVFYTASLSKTYTFYCANSYWTNSDIRPDTFGSLCLEAKSRNPAISCSFTTTRLPVAGSIVSIESIIDLTTLLSPVNVVRISYKYFLIWVISLPVFVDFGDPNTYDTFSNSCDAVTFFELFALEPTILANVWTETVDVVLFTVSAKFSATSLRSGTPDLLSWTARFKIIILSCLGNISIASVIIAWRWAPTGFKPYFYTKIS